MFAVVILPVVLLDVVILAVVILPCKCNHSFALKTCPLLPISLLSFRDVQLCAHACLIFHAYNQYIVMHCSLSFSHKSQQSVRHTVCTVITATDD